MELLAQRLGLTPATVSFHMKKLADAGVGTVVGMHFPESHYEEARKANVNLIISGHMASDSLGINLICDVWEKHGIEVFGTAGFSRFSRN